MAIFRVQDTGRCYGDGSLALPFATPPALGNGLVVTVGMRTPSGTSCSLLSVITDTYNNVYRVAHIYWYSSPNGWFATGVYYCQKVTATGDGFTITIPSNVGFGTAIPAMTGLAYELGDVGVQMMLDSYTRLTNYQDTATHTRTVGPLTGPENFAVAVIILDRPLSSLDINAGWTTEFKDLAMAMDLSWQLVTNATGLTLTGAWTTSPVAQSVHIRAVFRGTTSIVPNTTPDTATDVPMLPYEVIVPVGDTEGPWHDLYWKYTAKPGDVVMGVWCHYEPYTGVRSYTTIYVDDNVYGEYWYGDANYSMDSPYQIPIVPGKTYYIRIEAYGSPDIWQPTMQAFVSLLPPPNVMPASGGLVFGDGNYYYSESDDVNGTQPRSMLIHLSGTDGAVSKFTEFPQSVEYAVRLPSGHAIWVTTWEDTYYITDKTLKITGTFTRGSGQLSGPYGYLCPSLKSNRWFTAHSGSGSTPTVFAYIDLNGVETLIGTSQSWKHASDIGMSPDDQIMYASNASLGQSPYYPLARTNMATLQYILPHWNLTPPPWPGGGGGVAARSILVLKDGSIILTWVYSRYYTTDSANVLLQHISPEGVVLQTWNLNALFSGQYFDGASLRHSFTDPDCFWVWSEYPGSTPDPTLKYKNLIAKFRVGAGIPVGSIILSGNSQTSGGAFDRFVFLTDKGVVLPSPFPPPSARAQVGTMCRTMDGHIGVTGNASHADLLKAADLTFQSQYSDVNRIGYNCAADALGNWYIMKLVGPTGRDPMRMTKLSPTGSVLGTWTFNMPANGMMGGMTPSLAVSHDGQTFYVWMRDWPDVDPYGIRVYKGSLAGAGSWIGRLHPTDYNGHAGTGIFWGDNGPQSLLVIPGGSIVAAYPNLGRTDPATPCIRAYNPNGGIVWTSSTPAGSNPVDLIWKCLSLGLPSTLPTGTYLLAGAHDRSLTTSSKMRFCYFNYFTGVPDDTRNFVPTDPADPNLNFDKPFAVLAQTLNTNTPALRAGSTSVVNNFIHTHFWPGDGGYKPAPARWGITPWDTWFEAMPIPAVWTTQFIREVAIAEDAPTLGPIGPCDGAGIVPFGINPNLGIDMEQSRTPLSWLEFADTSSVRRPTYARPKEVDTPRPSRRKAPTPRSTGSTRTKRFTFTKIPGIGVQHISVGFQPSLVIVWTTRLPVDGPTDKATVCYGMTNGVIQQSNYICHTDNETSPTSAQSHQRDCLMFLTNGTSGATPTVEVRGVLTGFDATGFNIDWTVNDGVASIVHGIALGGFQVDLQGTLVSGTKTVTCGFRPSGFLAIGNTEGGPYNLGSPFGSIRGLGFSDVLRNVCNWTLGVGGTTYNARGIHNDRIATARTANFTGAGDLSSCAISAASDTGYTLQQTVSSHITTEQFIAAIKDAKVVAGIFTMPSGATSYKFDFGFKPGLLIFQSSGANPGQQSSMGLATGAWDSTGSQGGTWIGGIDGAYPTTYARDTYEGYILRIRTVAASGAASALAFSAKVTLVDETGVTLTFDANTIPSLPIIYFAIAPLEPKIWVTQFVREVAIAEDAPALNPVGPCGGTGVVPTGTNPNLGADLATARTPLIWLEFMLEDE